MQMFNEKKAINARKNDATFVALLYEIDEKIIRCEQEINNLYARRIELVRDYPY